MSCDKLHLSDSLRVALPPVQSCESPAQAADEQSNAPALASRQPVTLSIDPIIVDPAVWTGPASASIGAPRPGAPELVVRCSPTHFARKLQRQRSADR